MLGPLDSALAVAGASSRLLTLQMGICAASGCGDRARQHRRGDRYAAADQGDELDPLGATNGQTCGSVVGPAGDGSTT